MKLTKAAKEQKINNLLKAKKNIENGINNDGKKIKGLKEVYDAWRAFESLSYPEQLKIRAEWDRYYEAVRTTPSYEIFLAQKEALKQGNIARVKELAEDARKIHANNDYVLTKPKTTDPFEFDHGIAIKTYKNITRQIKDLTDYPIELELQEAFS